MNKKLLAAVMLLAPFFLYAAPVDALTVSPVKIEIEGDPGQTIGGVFELHNEESADKVLYASYENFEPSGDAGTPRFVGNADGLATWITATPQITLTPDQRVTIPYTISIPAGTQPGGYFAAIFYGAQDPSAVENGEVAIGGKLGVLVLLRVRGDITEDGGINRFSTEDDGRFYTNIPVTFVTQMTNRGADRITPRGNITVRNLLGGVVVKLTVNPNEGSILPNSSRTYTTHWQPANAALVSGFWSTALAQWDNFHVGMYRTSVELVWGADENVSSSSYTIFLFPWQILLVISSGLIIIFFGLRSYNRFIIRRARN
jgi:hypothetical protein